MAKKKSVKKKPVKKSKTVRKPTVKEVPKTEEFGVCEYCGTKLKAWQYEYCPACRRRLRMPLDRRTVVPLL